MNKEEKKDNNEIVEKIEEIEELKKQEGTKKENKMEEKKKLAEKELKKELKKVKKEASEFKKFISRGNVVDLAVGVVVGGAFTAISTSLVNDIITPFIGIIIGGLDLSNLALQIGDAKIAYGSFIQSIIDFLLIAISIFVVIRLFEKLKHKETKKEEKKEEPPKKNDEVVLLEEIRDLLKDKQDSNINIDKVEKQ